MKKSVCRRFQLTSVVLGVTLLTACAHTSTPSTSVAAPFQVVESSIASLHAALLSGQTSCQQVTQDYLSRIAAYDKDNGGKYASNPKLTSILTVNQQALTQAAELDAHQARTGRLIGPLHCVAVLPKDNIDTFDMPTTAGAVSLAHSQPPDDAFVVRKVRAAGGIILAKANLAEFAQTYTGESTLGGQPLNPYDLSKGPGGSSSGTAVGVSASLAAVGIGSDTGGSVRVPSAATALVGLRPSLRLVSQDGVMPLAPMQDTAGPMCRNVPDCARMLSVMVGYDAQSTSGHRSAPDRSAPLVANASQYQTMTGAHSDYTRFVTDASGLKGMRIGVVKGLYGKDAAVNQAIDTALEQMRTAGAMVEEVTVHNLPEILAYPSASFYEFKHALNEYLGSWPSDKDQHVRSYADIMASGTAMKNFKDYDKDYTDAKQVREYFVNVDARNVFVRARVDAAMNNVDGNGKALGQPYDVLIYPGMKSLPLPIGQQPDAMHNIRLGSFTGYPSMSIPAAMVKTSADAPALPVAFEVLARQFDEPTLIRVGSAWESLAKVRVAPPTTPAL